MKQVTERDFRLPEFRDADPGDYEFREDGAVVRKDRWEQGIRSIWGLLGNGRREFEISEVVDAVHALVSPPICWCESCRPITLDDMRMVICPECGNKRCPHANDHRNACTGSNEPGQVGSTYP